MKKILGNSPVTTIVGYALSALLVLQQYIDGGEKSYTKIGIAVLVAVLGRAAADATKNENETK